MAGVQDIFALKNDLMELTRLNARLNAFRARVGMSEKCCYEINLALEELFANYVSYGHPDCGEHRIYFNLSLVGSTLTIHIEEDGEPFNLKALPPPDTQCPLEKRRIGGLGVHLIKKVMDDIRYSRDSGKNMITLTKNL